MKNRPTRTADRRSFAFHPLSFAICLGFSGAALAAPQGGTVVAGQATITQPTPASQVINQTTHKAIIDWKSFSIAAGEKVRFNQPSTTAVTLNRVTGYDPSYILGEMSSNGKIFLVNPYGVVFGAGARVDVGGLVASTLSLANSDFLAGRYSLTSVDPGAAGQRGEVRNEGTISAPGGTVVLAGPTVTNTGTIVANGGRVGMVAANAVSVDVEGDGLLFFQTSATEAKNRLQQLGRIQADGGSIEMRAAARGAFADTVLNMTGIVQAKTIGSREGRIVIDGGSEGIVAVAGKVDATGLAGGERGGSVTVEGQRVLLDNGSVVDASGSAGGGAIRVGGDFHGANPDVRNAEVTGITSGAAVRADAVDAGNGGTVAIWSDGTTRFYGNISAQGGKNGGDGGFVEVSGKQTLDFQGNVSTQAPKGKSGTLLLDPTDIIIFATSTGAEDAELDADTPTAGDAAGLILSTDVSGAPAIISTAKLETIAATNSINLNASNSITITALSSNVITPNTLTLNTNGGSAQFHSGAGGFSMLAGNTIRVTNGSLLIDSGAGPISVGTLQASAGVTLTGGAITLNAPISVTTAGAGVSITGATTLAGTGGAITLTGNNAANDITLGTVNGPSTLAITANGGDVTLGVVGAGTALNGVSITANTVALQNVRTNGNQTYNAAVSAAAVTLDAGTGSIAADNPNNNFTGAVTLMSTGSDASVHDLNNLQLATPTLGANTGLTAIAGGALTLPGIDLSTGTGSIDLQANGGALSTPGTLTTTTGSITMVGSTGLTIAHDLSTTSGAVTLTGGGASGLSITRDITTTSGPISLTGSAAGGLTVSPNRTIDAGSSTIVADGGGGTVDFNTSTLQSTNSGAAAITVHNGTVTLGNITATSGGVVIGLAQDVLGTLGQTNNTTIAAGTLSVSAAGAIILGEDNAITSLGDVARGGAFTLNDIGGGLTLTGSVTGGTTTNAVNITTTGGTLALGGNSITGGTIDLTGVGVSQTVASTITAGGTATIAAGSGSINLQSPTNDFAGNVDLTTTSSAAVRDVDALLLNSFTGNGITAIAGTTLALPGGAISTTGGPINLQALGGTLSTSGNLTSNGGDITLVGATGLTVGNTLSSSGGAISLTGGAAGGLVVTTTQSVNAGSGTITLNGGGSAIQLNSSTLTTTDSSAAAVTIRNGTAVTLGNISAAAGTVQIGVGGDVSGAVVQTAGTTLTASTLAASTGNSINLGSAGTLTIASLGTVDRGGALTINDSAGGLTLTGNVTGGTTSNAVSITTATGPLTLGASDIAATTLTLNGVGVTQTSGTLSASGTTTVNAGSGSIDLQSASNDFASAVGSVVLTTTGPQAAIRDANDLGMAAPTLGAGTGFTAIAGANLNLPAGAISTTGAIELRSLGGTLATPGVLTATSIALTGGTGLTVANNLNATNVSLNASNAAITQSPGAVVTAGGATTFNAGSGTVTLDQANILGSIGGTGGTVSVTEASANGVVLAATNAANLTVATTQAGAPVTQNAPLVVSGTTTINTTGGGAVTLTDTSNNFGSFGATAGAVSVSAGNPIVLNAISAPSLVVDTSGGNGDVTQAAALNVTGATTISAGSGAITLGAANTLGSFGATGGAVSLTESSPGGIALDDVNAASLAVNTSAASGNVTQTALRTLTVAGATAVNAGAGAVTLINPGNDLGSFGAVGSAVSVRDGNALALDAINTGSLTVDTSASNGALTQNAAAIVTGATVVTTGSGPILLTNPGNDFSNLPGNSFSGGAISLRDSNDLTVTTLAAGANQAVSVIAGLGLSLPGGVNTGSANLTLASGAVLTTPGVLSGNNVSLSGSGGVSIGNNVNAAGNLNLTTTNSPVTQTGGAIVAGGTTTVTAGIGAVALTQPINDFNSINVVSGSVVNINDSNALTAAANASGNLTVTSTGPLTSGGTLSGASIALTGNAGINLGHNVITFGTLLLTTTNAAIDQTAGAITVGNLTTASAGSGDITLNQAGNDFSDFFGISAGGGAVRLRDANALIITSLVNGANKDLSLTAGTTITGLAGNIDTGSADLAITSGAGFTTFGTLRGTNVTLGGGTGGVSIGDNVTALGNLALNAINAPISQTAGTITAAGTTTASAGAGSINLALPGNDFATLAAAGSTVTVRDDNGLALGPVATTALTLDTSVGNGAVTQTGASVVSGTTTIAAGTGAVTLTNAGNDFASIGISGGAVSVTDSNAVVLNAINAASLTVNTSAGNGSVTQNAAAIVSGATAVNAGSGAVFLNSAGNNFGSVGATGGPVVIADVNALTLDTTNAGSLFVTAGGPINQNGAVVVSGTTTANAGTSAITLTNAGNNFANVGTTGGAVSITDSNALALDAISATTLTLNTAAGNGNITQNAAAIVSGATSANAGSGAVTLSNAANNFGSVAAVGGAVSVTDATGLTLGAISATSLTVNTAAGNGAVTQSGAAVVSGTSNVNAGSGAVTLADGGNDFTTLGVTGGAVSMVDANALALSGLISAPDQPVSVVAGGALTLPATAIDTGTAALTLTSGGPLTSVGTLRGTTVVLTSSGAMTLANDVTALGTLGLTTTNAPILQTGGSIVAVGTATVSAGSGDITLAQPSNNFQSSLLLSGGAVSVRDVDNLSVTSLVSGVNKPVSLIAGGSLSLPPSAIDTGTADLTLQALGGTLIINGPLSGNNVTLTGSAGLALGADITSSGDQIYTSTVQLANNVTLNSRGSKIDLQGGAIGNGNSLALTSSNAAADAIHTGGAITNTAQFTVTGNGTLGDNVTTTGNQSYSGPVTLGTDVALNSGASRIDLLSSVDAAGHNLALTSSNVAADAIRAVGVIANAAQLTVTGKSTFSSGVTTTGAQVYSDTVTLGNTSNFIGSSLGFGNGIVAGTFDLGLRSDALNFAGTVSGSGNAALSPLTQGATIGVAGGAGTYLVSQSTLDSFASFTSITVGRADGTGDLSFGNLVLPTSLSALSSSGDVGFTGTVASAAGQGRNLSVTSGGSTTFGGAVGGAIGGTEALDNLSVAGATQLNASTTANGNVSLGGPVTVGADATVSAAAVALGSTLDIGSHALTVLSDSLTVVGPATGSGAGSVRIAAKDAAGSMGIGGGAGTLQVSQGLIDTFAGVPTLTLGRSDSTGTITAGSLTLPTDLAIANGSGAVAFTGSVDSAAGPARDLTVSTTGTTSFAGTVGTTLALDALSVSGSSQFGANVVTTGAQTYTGPATLLGDSTLTGPSVSFGNTVDGASALTVNAATTNFAGAVGGTTALTSLTTNAAGTTQLGSNVTTSGSQTYNDALLLNGNAVLSGSTLNLAGSVDGAHTLAVNGSTGVTLGGLIGAGTALAGLSVAGPLQLSAGSITTTGAQSYAGATTLGAATTLNAPSIAFGNTLDGGFALTTQGAGTASFAGAIGATTPLASLTANGGGAVQLSSPSVDTTGAQSYSGALQLTGSSRLTGSALTLTGPVSGATDLTLQANALSGGSSISGTGVLTISPLDPTLSIGVAGGAGTVQVSQAALDGASGFSGHVIGRTDGSGTITAGNLVLRANTTLQTATGDLNVGSVDGAFALALNSGGTTRITGSIGAGTPVASLTTDNNAAAADWNGTTGERTTLDSADGTGAARVITSGAQTYNDPVTATVPVAFSGGAITATQAANRFDGVVSANAISLDLHNAADLRLGTLTLVNGGSLETDGVLHVAGAVQLNGGVLTLTSNATPTPIDLSDPEYAGKSLSFGFVPIKEASPTIVQDAGGTIGTAAGSLLVLRAPAGGSILLEQPGNTLLGQVSAVSGTLGDNDVSRFNNASGLLTLGFLRIVSSEIHVAGRPPANGDQTLQQAGLEADVIKVTADVLTTGPDGLLRAHLPFNNIQGSQTSIPGLTLAMSPTALANGGGFGGPDGDEFIQVRVGGAEGGFLTARPKGATGDTAVIFIGGDSSVTPFYDGSGKITEIRIFYNGNAPRTPQETGALAAVIALIEDARQARFEEAVRTENVRSRLRSGVIAEVGAGRPATVGRESIRLPDTCEIKPKTLLCE